MTVLPFKRDVSFNDALESFFILRPENTKHHYKTCLNAWLKFLSDRHKSWQEARENDSAAFLEEVSKHKGQKPRRLGSERVSKSTLRNYAQILHLINSHLIEQGALEHDIFENLLHRFKGARTGDKRPTEAIDFEMVDILLQSQSEKQPKSHRNRLFLMVLFGLGLRINEALQLCLGDITDVNGLLVVRLRNTKSQHEQELPVAEWLSLELRRYMQHRNQQGAFSQSPLFPSYKAHKATNEFISQSTGARLFKRLLNDAGIDGTFTPHSARATFITRLLSDGYDYRHVQEASRHSSVQLVEKYDKRRISLEENPARNISYKKNEKT